ncbi:MAG: hypothetical protein CMQ46_10225 [Gammaproteobacteria bacterium]|nr:hypothetical protein [Gammaproteobacteria bacterium]MBJ55624.1 hypothetical protein [Gammaproteobacteria bacterium]HBN16026.1 hypothetical protein [Pseudohongiella sp.]|tara:strand:+ start:652 stop:945 length:294 start_codon:yes stop_codon:yes gene_type:complete
MNTIYTGLKSLIALACFCLVLVTAVYAQQPAQQEDVQDDSQASQQGSSDGDAADEPNAEMPDIDSQPIEPAEGDGPGRFIPSEQISQDLGVSFPVDI